MNDNSNDKTLEVLKSIQKEDFGVEIITNTVNRGALYNRIFGAIQARGEYVTF